MLYYTMIYYGALYYTMTYRSPPARQLRPAT